MPKIFYILCTCLLGGRVWACPLMGVLCACSLCLLIQMSGVLTRTLSHMWWRLYLPRLLLSAWSSLPTMVKLLGLVLFPEVLQCPKMGEGSWMCWLYPSPKVLQVSPMYSPSHASSLHCIFLMVLFPLKWVWTPYLLHMFLMLYLSPCVYGMTMCPLVCLSLVVSLPSGSPLLSLLSPLHPLCFPHYYLPSCY